MVSQNEQLELIESLLDEYRNDITAFAFDVFESVLRPKQVEFANAAMRSKRVTFKGGVGFGKTHILAIFVWWSLFCHDRVKCSIFGPSEAQLKSGVWNEMHSLWERMPEEFKSAWDVTATKISRKTAPSNCYAEFRLASKDNVAASRGIHADNNFIVVDEATGVSDEILKGALQNHLTSDPNPKLILISNPNTTSGYFWDTWNDEDISPHWVKVHGRMADNPRVTEADLEMEAKQRGGKSSNDYIIHVEGDFPSSDDDGLIPAYLIDASVEREDAVPSDLRPIHWGVDPAGPGRDRSVIVKRHDNKIIGIEERRGLSITQLSYLIRDQYQALTPAERKRVIISVDANGLGRGLADNLADFGLPVKAVTTQSSPTKGRDAKGNEKFAKLRDQLWWEVKEWFATEAGSIPFCVPLIRELKAPTYDYDNRGAIKVEGKKEMKKRLKMSPDYADALCLTFAAEESRYFGKFSWSKPLVQMDLRVFE